MDRATLDAAYDNSAAVADRADYLARWRTKSAEMRASSGAKLDIAYGTRQRDATRLLSLRAQNRLRSLSSSTAAIGSATRRRRSPSSPKARSPTASTSRWWAIRLRRKPGCPRSSGRSGQSLTFLAEHAGDFGFDRRAMFVGGWSAGGHLTAAVSSHPSFRGGIPISGIFDLEPIALGELNDKLGLDQTEIDTLSPLNTLVERKPPAPARSRRQRAARTQAAVGGSSPRPRRRAACRCD